MKMIPVLLPSKPPLIRWPLRLLHGVVFVTFLCSSIDARTFVSVDGKIFKGKLVHVENESVVIKRSSDNKKFTIPKARFTDNDQAYFKKWLAEQKPPADLKRGRPSDHGIDEQKLIELARWIEKNQNLPIFSVLISRNGTLVFELYTPGIDRDDSHYLMSATKSVLSTLIGIAIDQRLIASEETPLSELIPETLFKDRQHQKQFEPYNLKHVMGMSVLDVNDRPWDMSPADKVLNAECWKAENRLEFLLTCPLLKKPGVDMNYNDMTPVLGSGILSYRSGLSAYDYAQENLFEPLKFKNAEWMHQGRNGIDNGGYGLRLRPIDMQKIGILFLNNGKWGRQQIISEEWVKKTRVPYIGYSNRPPHYGYYWWKKNYGDKHIYQTAAGWKGQFILINYEKNIVVTMTACLEKEDWNVLSKIIKDFVIPAVDPEIKPKPIVEFASVVRGVNEGKSRIAANIERRMIPEENKKEKAIKFKGK